jgi:hypothetical protein
VGPAGSAPAPAATADAPAEPAPADLMVLFGATGPAVAAAVRRYPAIPLVGVVWRSDPVDLIVDVLEAGADACVRDGSLPVIVSHLRACERRRTADPAPALTAR